ncbi:MAG: four-carbon acid sugar kinase family protein [Candidatus Bathyarchaeia archaeon]
MKGWFRKEQRSPLKVGIVADDLTGASDSAAQFARKGLSTVVSPLQGLSPKLNKHDIVAVSTETRMKNAKQAYESVVEAASRLTSMGFNRLYKKVDSTLRGNFAVELDAIMEIVNPAITVFSPAYPAAGRTLVGGVVRLNDSFRSLGLNWALKRCAPYVLKRDTSRRIAQVGLSVVRKGGASMSRHLGRLIKEGFDIAVVDAESNLDLKITVESSADFNGLLCGSAGLADAYASHLTGECSKILVVSGSVNPQTLSQITRLEKVYGVEATVPRPDSLNADNLLGKCREGLSSSRLAVLASAKSVGDVQASSRLICLLTSKVVEVGVELASEVDAVILVGGEMASRFMAEAGVKRFKVVGEACPGIPILKGLGGRLNGTPFITKAGGFGEVDVLVSCVERLKDRVHLKKIF